jgi:large subunit ribosomal protein L4e
MKLKILSTTGSITGETELPIGFSEPLRTDLIKKAVLCIQNNKRQAYASYKEAGQRHAVKISKRRRDFKGSYGKGISRVPRKTLSHRGSQFFWVGANAPGTVGGRKAHPPKVEKVWAWKLNAKEKRKATCSAMSAVMIKELVA